LTSERNLKGTNLVSVEIEMVPGFDFASSTPPQQVKNLRSHLDSQFRYIKSFNTQINLNKELGGP